MKTTLSDDALRLVAEMRAEADIVLTGGPTWSDDSPKSTTGILRRGADTIDTLRRERDERADAVEAQAKCFSGLVAQAEATIAAQAAEIARKDAALAPFAAESYSSGPQHEFVTVKRADCDCAAAALQPTETPATVAGDAVIRDDLHEYCGSDAARWAEQFRLMATKLGYSDMDEGWLIGWFANAIERSIQVRHPPTLTQSGAGEMAEFKLAKRPVAFRITAPAETGWSWLYFRDEQKAAETAAELGCEYEGLYVRDGTPLVEPTLTQSGAGEPVGEALDADFADYDAGLLNDFGGGNVDWWWDYLRAEIGRANDFWRSQVDAALSPLPPQEPRHDRCLRRSRAMTADLSRTRLTKAQMGFLNRVDLWGRDGIYVPYALDARTAEACERKGVVVERSVSRGAPRSGYSLTEAGRAALEAARPSLRNAPMIDQALIERVRSEAAKAGWNAARRSIYAVCEDVIEEYGKHREDTENPPRHYFGRGGMTAAKSIARGFNAMEAEDDDNLAEAILALNAKDDADAQVS